MTTTILFTGYAPVHHLCFRPLHRALARRLDVEVFVSGGLRRGADGSFVYDGPGLYRRFAIPDERILPVAALPDRRFDLAFAASRRVLAPPENVGVSIQILYGVSFRNRSVRAENLALRPPQLTRALRDAGHRPIHLAGIAYDARRDEFRLSRDTATNYLMATARD